MRCAIVNLATKVVENVIEYETLPGSPPPGFTEGYVAIAHDRVGPGWTWDGVKLIEPPPLPPPPAPPEPTADQVYDQSLLGNRVLRAVVLAINDGTLVPGANRTPAQLKAIIKARM